MKRIVITGVTLTGNMGGVAMLRTAYAEMSRRFPEAQFSLLSISPEEDLMAEPYEQLNIVNASPMYLVGIYLPLSILLWPFQKIGLVRILQDRIRYFKVLRNADIVIDLSGIAFVDGRGLPLLLYNLACFMPAITMNIPVAKLSQALGPFSNSLNRVVARFSLSRCDLVVGRGETTGSALTDLGLKNSIVLPDVTFCLDVPAEAREQAVQILNLENINRPLVIISPSEVVRRLLVKREETLEQILIEIIRYLSKNDVDVILLPHSFGHSRSKNNDVGLCYRIAELVKPELIVPVLDNVQDPVILRAIIGKADMFIGCRFHAVVAALAMKVPALTIGWSHKYHEMAAMFGLQKWVIPAEEFTADIGLERWRDLQSESDLVRMNIADAITRVRAGASENFTLAARLIDDKC